ncbi:MAG: methylated-DNA--[protein]-cysteine S-methyltransferase [Brachymonas sp.]|nr:methylated-DNA--[protein]-cysteine S-methyltransferase [Brachymonas sp.]
MSAQPSQPPLAQTLPFKRIAAAIEYLYDHAREQPSLEAIAAQVHLSPAHLQRQFQQLAGISPKKMLQHLSLENAKAVLAQQGSVQDAALEAGLSGSGRLHDLFVTIEGMTPGAYKSGGANLTIRHTFAATPLGEVLLAATDQGLCWLAFADDHSTALHDLQREYSHATHIAAVHPLHARALAAFAAKTATETAAQKPTTPLPLHLKGTPFQLKVWQALLHIPPGCLQSYGHLAAAIGQPSATRAVGTAVGRNPVAVLIPCHRVIRDSGVIGQYRWQRGRKLALLAQELSAHNQVKEDA